MKGLPRRADDTQGVQMRKGGTEGPSEIDETLESWAGRQEVGGGSGN